MGQSKPKILIVDDEEDIRLTLESVLRAEGYEPFVAATGAEALEKVATIRPDLVLLDIMMPDIDGYEVCRQIKEREATRQTAVVFASALRKTRNKVAGLDLGADDYVTKPYDMPELMAKLRALFRGQEHQRRLERLVTFARSVNRLDHGQIATAVRERFGEIVSAERYSIFIVDADQLRLFAHNHLDEVTNLALAEVSESPLMYEVQRTGERQLIQDYSSSEYSTGDDREKYDDGYALCLPLKVDGRVVGLLNLNGNEHGFFSTGDYTVAELAAEILAVSLNNAQLLAEQKKLAVTDGLTKLYNHRYFQEQLGYEWARVERYGHAITCLMLDIDHFKSFNDTHGHKVGDEVLRELALRLRGMVREVDTVARYGGEEFTVILPETELAVARQLAERIRERIAGTPFVTGVGPLPVTISVGLCDSKQPEIDSAATLVIRADQALYVAKRGGRNMVVADGEGA